MEDRGEWLEKARTSHKESRHLDFKESFDPESSRDWTELVKDVVAMANSGGGVLVFGVRDDGSAADYDPGELLRYDPAKITDKVAKYTEVQFSDFELITLTRKGRSFAALIVEGTPLPMVFAKEGTYAVEHAREKIAFRKGTVYFRHGAKSEPGITADVRGAVEREVKRLRRSWLGGIRKMVKAPLGHRILVATAPAKQVRGDVQLAGKIVADERAPAIRPVNADDLWPYRQKEVIRLVRERLGNAVKVNTHDMLCVRKVNELEEKHPDFVHKPFRRSTAQYSAKFVEWLVARYTEDPSFFEKARGRYKEMAP